MSPRDRQDTDDVHCVVADQRRCARRPRRLFAKGSRKATAGIDSLYQAAHSSGCHRCGQALQALVGRPRSLTFRHSSPEVPESRSIADNPRVSTRTSLAAYAWLAAGNPRYWDPLASELFFAWSPPCPRGSIPRKAPPTDPLCREASRGCRRARSTSPAGASRLVPRAGRPIPAPRS